MKKYLIIIIASLLVACGPKISAEQSEKLENLTLKVDSAVDILTNTIDSNRLITLTSDYLNKQSFFENDMKDTVDRETIFLIDEFMRDKKAIKYLSANYGPFMNEAKAMKEQLQDLKLDIDNRLVDQEQFKKYYDLENNNFLELDNAVKTIKDVYLRVDSELVRRTPKIDSIINAYNLKSDA